MLNGIQGFYINYKFFKWLLILAAVICYGNAYDDIPITDQDTQITKTGSGRNRNSYVRKNLRDRGFLDAPDWTKPNVFRKNQITKTKDSPAYSNNNKIDIKFDISQSKEGLNKENIPDDAKTKGHSSVIDQFHDMNELRKYEHDEEKFIDIVSKRYENKTLESDEEDKTEDKVEDKNKGIFTEKDNFELKELPLNKEAKGDKAKEIMKEEGFNPDKIPSDLSDDVVDSLQKNNAMNVNTKEFLEENDIRHESAIENIEKSLDSIDQNIINFDDPMTEKEKTRELQKNSDTNSKQYKEVSYPNLNVNGMILNVDSYVPHTFDAIVNAAQKHVDSEPNEKQDKIMFRQDYTSQIRKMRQDEYSNAKYTLEQEYAHIKAIEEQLRLLKDKKNRLKSNLELIHKKHEIDVAALSKQKAIANEKITSFSEARKDYEKLEKYRISAISIFDKYLRIIGDYKKAYKTKYKTCIIQDSIINMENNFKELNMYVEKFFLEAKSSIDEIKQSVADIDSISKDMKKEYFAKTIKEREDRVLRIIDSVNTSKIMLLDLVEHSDKSMGVDIVTVGYNGTRRTLSNQILKLETWYNNFFEITEKLRNEMSSLLDLKMQSKKNEVIEKSLDKLLTIDQANIKIMDDQYNILKGSIDRVLNEEKTNIRNVKNKSENNQHVFSLSIDKIDRIMDEAAKELAILQNLSHWKINLDRFFYSKVYNIDDLIKELKLSTDKLLEHEKYRMEIQRERYLKTRKGSQYNTILKMEDDFWRKYELFINQKRSVLDNILNNANEKHDKKDNDFVHGRSSLKSFINNIANPIMERAVQSLRSLKNLEVDYTISEETLKKGINNCNNDIKSLSGKVYLFFNELHKIYASIERISSLLARENLANDLEHDFSKELIKCEYDEKFIARKLDNVQNNKNDILLALDKSEETLLGKLDEVKGGISEESKRLDSLEKTIRKEVDELRHTKVRNDMMGDKFVNYINYKSELANRRKHLVQEYEYLSEAVVEDEREIELEELSLNTQKKNAINKIKSLQAFLNRSLGTILHVVPTEENSDSEVTEAYIKGYDVAKTF